MKFLSAVLLLAFALVPVSSASIISVTLPEFNGDGDPDIGILRDAGTFLYLIPAGEVITAIEASGSFGTSEVASTAVMDVFIEGILVAQCPDMAAPCWNTGPTPWSYMFGPADFAFFTDGAAPQTVLQNDCCIIRLGETTLEITTAATAIPEPTTLLLFSSGLVALIGLGRRRRRVSGNAST